MTQHCLDWNSFCNTRDFFFMKKILPAIVFTNGPEDLGSILGWVIPKTQKWYLMPPCLTLSFIRYGSRVKWSNPGKELCPPLHIGVVAIEKELLSHPRLKGDNFTYLSLLSQYCDWKILLQKKTIPHSSEHYFPAYCLWVYNLAIYIYIYI